MLENLADIKRRAVVGAHLRTTYHRYEATDRKLFRGHVNIVGMVRRVGLVKTTEIAMETWKPDGLHYSFLRWPKASEVRIAGPDTFEILEGRDLLMAYEFVDLHPDIEVKEGVDDCWFISINGYQWGGEVNRSGAGNQTYNTEAEAFIQALELSKRRYEANE